MRDDYITIRNTPTEFVLTGPVKGRDRILVRSDNAGLDLIGRAVQEGLYSEHDGIPGIASVMFGKTRQLNVISSYPLPDKYPELDSRESSLRFAWQGYASKLGIKIIEKSLNATLPELYRAIQENDIQNIELALSPVIYRCTEANDKRLRSRRFMWVTLAIYAAAALFAIVFQLSRELMK